MLAKATITTENAKKKKDKKKKLKQLVKLSS